MGMEKTSPWNTALNPTEINPFRVEYASDGVSIEIQLDLSNNHILTSLWTYPCSKQLS